jgi:hypothetical protein
MNGAVLCPGSVAAVADIDGTWANSKFEATSSFFQANDWKSQFTMYSNRPITFLSQSDFELVIPDIYDLSGTPVYYDFLSPLVTSSEPLTYLREGDVADSNPNKEGRAAVICAGQSWLSFYNNNALQQIQVADIASGSNSQSFSATSVGQYQLTSSFPAFSCVGATKTINIKSTDPDFSNSPLNPYITIYGSGTGLYPTTPSDAISFTVKDPKLLASTTRYFPTTTMEMKYSSNTYVYLRVTNNGQAGKDVGLKVTGVSLDQPSTTGFTVSAVTTAQVMDPLNPGSMINNMYNKEIVPGSSGIIVVSVNSPSNFQTGSNIKLKLNIQATSLTCANLPAGQTYEFSNTTTDVPVNPGTDFADCVFSPTTAEALPNEILSYNLTCFNSTGSVIACTGNNAPVITVAPTQYAILAATPSQITGPKTLVRVKAVSEGWALISAILDDNGCTAVIDVNNPNQAQSCEFVPSSGSVNAQQPWAYQVKCYDKKLFDLAKKQVPCSDTPGYSLDVTPANLVLSNVPSGNNMVLTPAAPGTLTLTAGSSQAVHPFSCSATLTATQPPDFDSCNIEPTQWDTTAIGQYGFFTLNCYKNGVQIACPFDQTKVDINFTKNVATLFSYTPTSTSMQSVIIVSSASYNNGVMTVTDKATKAFCSANINVQSSTENNCVLYPNAGMKDVGQTQTIRINCTENTNKVPCSGVTWSTSGATAALTYKSNTGSIARFDAPGVSTITATVTSQTGTPATYTCSASFRVSGVYGNLCRISPLSANLINGSNQKFNVTCYDTTVQPKPITVPCLDVSWAVTVPQATLAATPRQDTVIGGFPEVGVGNVRATIGADYPTQRYSCSAPVTVQAPTTESGDGCTLSGPSSATKNTPFNVGITCFDRQTNNIKPCVGVDWRLMNNLGLISGDDTGAVVSLSGNDTIDVLLNGKDGCKLKVDVGDGNGEDGPIIGGNGDCDSIVQIGSGTDSNGVPVVIAQANCGDGLCENPKWYRGDGTALGVNGNNPVYIPISVFGGANTIVVNAKVGNTKCPDTTINVASVCRQYI